MCQVKIKQALKIVMSISSEGNAYLQASLLKLSIHLIYHFFRILKVVHAIYNYSLFIKSFIYVGEPVLEALQARPSFLFCCYENFRWAGLSSCVFVGTFHAIIFSPGMLLMLH